MTQYEILKFAMIGISARIDRENEINDITKKDIGRENQIAIKKLEKLTAQFAEVINMMGNIEKAQ